MSERTRISRHVLHEGRVGECIGSRHEARRAFHHGLGSGIILNVISNA